MYQSFVRGTLNKKRQSQYSERKQQREQDRFQMQHNPAQKDFNEFNEKQQMIHNMKTTVNINDSDQKNAAGNKNNFFNLAKNQN